MFVCGMRVHSQAQGACRAHRPHDGWPARARPGNTLAAPCLPLVMCTGRSAQRLATAAVRGDSRRALNALSREHRARGPLGLGVACPCLSGRAASVHSLGW